MVVTLADQLLGTSYRKSSRLSCWTTLLPFSSTLDAWFMCKHPSLPTHLISSLCVKPRDNVKSLQSSHHLENPWKRSGKRNHVAISPRGSGPWFTCVPLHRFQHLGQGSPDRNPPEPGKAGGSGSPRALSEQEGEVPALSDEFQLFNQF